MRRSPDDDRLLASFDTIFSGFKEITRCYSDAQQQALFYGTANRVYRPVRLGK